MLNAALGVGIGLLVSWGTKKITEAAQRVQNVATQSKEAADAAQSATSSLKDLVNAYEELGDKSGWDTDDFDQAKDIQAEILDLAKEQGTLDEDKLSKLNLQNGKYEEQLGLLQDITAEQLEASRYELTQNKDAQGDKLVDTAKKNNRTHYLTVWSAPEMDMGDQIKNAGIDVFNKFGGYGPDDLNDADSIIDYYNEVGKALKYVIDHTTEAERAAGGTYHSLYQFLLDEQSALRDDVDSYNDSTDAINNNTNARRKLQAKMVSALPAAGQVQGVIYFRMTDYTMHIWNGVEFVQLNKKTITQIPADATNDDIPTTKAVADYVQAKVAAVEGIKGKFVTDVTYNAGVLSVAKGDEPVTTTMTGIVHEPTYDAETRTIKLPVFGGDTLTIALGKDLVVKSGIYNTETHEIELTITTGEVIKIPVGSLIDIYIGVATSTATVTVSDDNKISVDVRVSAKANNSITIEEDGLYVAVPDAYTKSETDAKIKKVQDQLDGHSKDAVVHITAEERKAWNAKVSQDELTAAKSEVISAAAADATKKADAARDTAKTYADGLNTAMDNRVKNVEGALTWKAIDDSGANAET